MRRVVVSVGLLPILLFMLAAPAAAAPPLRESGTQKQFFSVSSTCSQNSCTDTFLDAFSIDANTLLVCVSSFTYNIRTGRPISQESGCSETSNDALVIGNDLSATLAETAVTFVDCNRRGCVEGDTVIVSASDTAFGPVFSETGRGTFTDGTCTFRFRFTSTSSEVAGTMTIDGVVYEQSGFAGISEFTVSSRCG